MYINVLCAFMYVHVRMYVNIVIMCMYACMYMYICTYVCTYVHIYMYVYIIFQAHVCLPTSLSPTSEITSNEIMDTKEIVDDEITSKQEPV